MTSPSFPLQESASSSKQILNISSNSSCDSIPEEFHHSPTIPNSPTETRTDSMLEASSRRKSSHKKLQRKDIAENVKDLMKSFGSISHLATHKEANRCDDSEVLNLSTRDDHSRSYFRTQKKGYSKLTF